jgi:hypothetical protein
LATLGAVAAASARGDRHAGVAPKPVASATAILVLVNPVSGLPAILLVWIRVPEL